MNKTKKQIAALSSMGVLSGRGRKNRRKSPIKKAIKRVVAAVLLYKTTKNHKTTNYPKKP